MNNAPPELEPSEAFMDIARRMYPRHRCGYHSARAFQEASDWSRTLDWRNNPYDRFLLIREIVLHFEQLMHEDPRKSIFRMASRDEILSGIDVLLERYPEHCQRFGPDFEQIVSVYVYLCQSLPWLLAYTYEPKVA